MSKQYKKVKEKGTNAKSKPNCDKHKKKNCCYTCIYVDFFKCRVRRKRMKKMSVSLKNTFDVNGIKYIEFMGGSMYFWRDSYS